MAKKAVAKATTKKTSAPEKKQEPMDPQLAALMERDAKEKKDPTPEQMKRITDLADEVGKITDYIARGEEAIKKAKERLATIQTKELVDLMDEFGIDTLGLPKWNADINVITHVHASLPALPAPHKEDFAEKLERRTRGLAWLRKEGHDGLIGNEVAILFPKGQDKAARAFQKEMAKRAKDYAKVHDGEAPFQIDSKEEVRWNALTKLIKDLVVGQGRTDVPLADLGASVFRMAKIDARSERKK